VTVAASVVPFDRGEVATLQVLEHFSFVAAKFDVRPESPVCDSFLRADISRSFDAKRPPRANFP